VVLYGPGRWVLRLAVGQQRLETSPLDLSVAFWDHSPARETRPVKERQQLWTVTSSRDGNLRFGRAHNQLAKAVPPDCEYLLLLNPDAVLQYDCLGGLLAVAEANPGAGLIEAAQFPIEHPKRYDPSSLETNWYSAACALVRRRAFDELGGFDPQFFLYCEDIDLSWRAWRCHYLPEARCLHVTEGEILGKETTFDLTT
jgi:hypothetical protein